MKKEENKKKKIILIIVITIAVCFLIFILIHVFPFLLFSGYAIWQMLVKPDKPINTHGEFPFEIIYEYKGERKVINDTIICDYDGYSYALETGNTNDWTCYYKNNDDYATYYIDKENEPDLYIYVPDAADYYMGENLDNYEETIPHIRYISEDDETIYNEEEYIDLIDIKIIEWNPSEPLKNNFK